MDFVNHDPEHMLNALQIEYENTNLNRFGKHIFEAGTHIGLRLEQEDRLILCPNLFGNENISLCGVFDGTVGDHASEFIQKNFMKHFFEIEEIHDMLNFDHTSGDINILLNTLQNIFRKSFVNSDRALIDMCHSNALHYASSTGVVVFLLNDILTVAHVGDSRASIAREINGQLFCEMLTISHKPNTPSEQQRIQQCGGSVVYLHKDKPFIRGGDFTARQRTGERPKQLNYSRAFGGKDLKMFGLSVDPDVSHFRIGPEDRLVVLASDGLWDVMHAQEASEIALNAVRSGRSPSQELITRSIELMHQFQVKDNITVIVIFLNMDESTHLPTMQTFSSSTPTSTTAASATSA